MRVKRHHILLGGLLLFFAVVSGFGAMFSGYGGVSFGGFAMGLAIIVGGGHNGLVCAHYLAKRGKKVVVLERRDVVGGAAVTEEGALAPDKRAVAAAGKMDARKRLAADVAALMGSNVNQAMGMMLDSVVF